jgi:ABC-type dipeptide/oligopeptide/nickel transport system permease subunit
MRRNFSAWVSLLTITTIGVLAVLVPVLSPFAYDQQDIERVLLGPSSVNWFGTDQLGRDLFTRVFFGARLSIGIGVLSSLSSLLFGGLYGSIAGWLGGVTDRVMMRVVDTLQSIPAIVLLILIGVAIDAGGIFVDPVVKSLAGIILSLTVVGWVSLARLMRAQVLHFKKAAFIEGARAVGAKDCRIIRRHIVPNAIGPVIVMLTAQIQANILFESFLSFLGLGFQPPLSSWGVLAADGWHVQTDPHLIIFPGLALFLTTLAFNTLGDGLRDALDPRSRWK